MIGDRGKKDKGITYFKNGCKLTDEEKQYCYACLFKNMWQNIFVLLKEKEG